MSDGPVAAQSKKGRKYQMKDESATDLSTQGFEPETQWSEV